MLILFFIFSLFSQASPISGEVLGTSNFIWRGVTFSNNRPALQAVLDYELKPDLVLGSFFSNAEFSDPAMGEDAEVNHEIDVYLAKTFSWSTGDIRLSYSYFTFGNADFFNADEVNLKLSQGSWRVELSYMNDFFGYDSSYHYLRVGRVFELSDQEELGVHLGFNHFKNRIGSKVTGCLDSNCAEEAFGLTGVAYNDYLDFFIAYNRELLENTTLQVAYNMTNRKEFFYDGTTIAPEDGKDNSTLVTVIHRF